MKKLQSVVSHGGVGLIRTADIQNLNVDWSIVSPEFKQEFLRTYKEALESINSKHNSNYGHNIMSFLDVLLDNLKSYSNSTFEEAYDNAIYILFQSISEKGVQQS